MADDRGSIKQNIACWRHGRRVSGLDAAGVQETFHDVSDRATERHVKNTRRKHCCEKWLPGDARAVVLRSWSCLRHSKNRALSSSRKRPKRPESRAPAAGQRRRSPPRPLAGDGPGNSRDVTSHDVASLAGVSRSAVSRSFTPDASVSEKTRNKVLAAASRLGYQPNVIARSLITRQSRLIGLIMGEWENPFYTTMLRGFTERLGARDYRVMLLASRVPADVDVAMRMLMQYRVDGMVLVSASPSEAVTNEYLRGGGRLVMVNREAEGMSATGIVCDNPRVGRELAERMLAAGYRRFAMLRGDPTVRSSGARAESFRAGIEASPLGQIVLDRSDVSGYAAGRAFGNEIVTLPTRPDAIFCSTDVTAIGVLDLTSGSVLKALGIKSEALVQPSESWRNPASSGGLPLTQRIGAAARQRFSGILAPSWLATVVASSAVPLVNLVLFLSGPPDWQPMSGRVDLRAPPGRYG